MSDERVIQDFIRSLYAEKAMRYKALGMKPGEGGRFASSMEGYESAVSDVMKLIPLLRQRA